MLRSLMLLLVGCALLSAPACSSGDQYAPPPSDEAMLSDAKQMVLEFVATAKKSPREAAINVAGLHESLAAIENPKLDPVKATSEELVGLYARSAPASESNPVLDRLAQLAESL